MADELRDDGDDRDPVEAVAEEFALRWRLGERPSVAEYAARHPELAEALEALLPTVAFLERGKRGRIGSRSGTDVGPDLGELPCERLGENRLLRELGRGGMGVVYEAEQEPLGRRVAVKVLPRAAMFDPRSRARFLREAQIVAKLRHPHIVPVFTAGEQDGVPYLVMELIEGVGLDRLMGEQPSGEFHAPGTPAYHQWVVRIGLQAAEALAFAHEQGYLHRDIKPANLLLEPTGHLWLTDFGLARLAEDQSLTGTGDLPGTLRYMAPECLDRVGDVCSDVYSLGLTLRELLLGQSAFAEPNSIRLLQQVREGRMPPIRKVDPSIPRDLEAILAKATALDPEDRYPDARALAADLQRFLEGAPILPGGFGLGRWKRRIRRNPLVSSLVASTIVLGLIAAYFVRLWWFAPHYPPDEPGRPGPRFPEREPPIVAPPPREPGPPWRNERPGVRRPPPDRPPRRPPRD